MTGGGRSAPRRATRETGLDRPERPAALCGLTTLTVIDESGKTIKRNPGDEWPLASPITSGA